jgi:hypothetical protein
MTFRESGRAIRPGGLPSRLAKRLAGRLALPKSCKSVQNIASM